MNSKANILIVDDDEVVRLALVRILRSANCDVYAARNGTEALQAMNEQPRDLVLLDMRMPGADGLSVLKAIKEKWPAAEVVVVTGFPTLESAKEAVRLGAYDYLAKPVGPDEVMHAANGALLHKRWALQCDPQASSVSTIN